MSAENATSGPDAGPDVAERPESTERSPSRWRPLLGVIPAVLVVGVGVWEMGAARRAGADVPGDRAWRLAEINLRSRHQKGELIVFAPRWIDPVGRMHFGDLMPIHEVARMDDARYPTVWEVSIRGASAPESRGRDVAFERDYRGVRVRKLVRAPARVLTDFVARFDYDRDRMQVTGPSVDPVGVVLAEVGFTPRRCVRVQPQPDRTVRVAFRGVDIGSELVGHVGLADVFTRQDVRAPGRLQVFIDEREVVSTVFGNDDGWVRFSARTQPGRADVSFAATALGADAEDRLICFAAEARE